MHAPALRGVNFAWLMNPSVLLHLQMHSYTSWNSGGNASGHLWEWGVQTPPESQSCHGIGKADLRNKSGKSVPSSLKPNSLMHIISYFWIKPGFIWTSGQATGTSWAAEGGNIPSSSGKWKSSFPQKGVVWWKIWLEEKEMLKQHLMKMNFPCLPTIQTMPLSLSTRKERDSREGEITGQLSSSTWACSSDTSLAERLSKVCSWLSTGHEVRCAQGKQPLENVAKDFSFSRVPVATKCLTLSPHIRQKSPKKKKKGLHQVSGNRGAPLAWQGCSQVLSDLPPHL